MSCHIMYCNVAHIASKRRRVRACMERVEALQKAEDNIPLCVMARQLHSNQASMVSIFAATDDTDPLYNESLPV